MSVVQDLLAWWWATCLLLGIWLAPMVLVDRSAVGAGPSGLFDGLWSRRELVSGKKQSVLVAPHSTSATAHGLESLFALSNVIGISGQDEPFTGHAHLATVDRLSASLSRVQSLGALSRLCNLLAEANITPGQRLFFGNNVTSGTLIGKDRLTTASREAYTGRPLSV
ncbi:uncharacterized protein F5Z01DRAFT_210052 [Emericellopsis atlantica]|uniref:Uncharacterized protein n=1 Tax=Emericellopsis atlantica TaxID=2614577 RepID=A0A9P8CTB2_9HYPO|nr:uncharacterized protein F5Z01DRAFT_210052 [Emericellopsis atlantica]KAG9258658.1 hypothetical protein F5Z01DRAFT_210052 [Emericellopsis atlantica]